MYSLKSVNELTCRSIKSIFERAAYYKRTSCQKYKKMSETIPCLPGLTNKIVGIMFFEPSTRTNYSFQTALHNLGIKFIEYNHNISSSKKGESLQDTIKTFECFCDLLIIRHPDKDIFKKVVFEKPVINAGNGSDEHPTQALLDLFTIYDTYLDKDFNIKKPIKISFVGDIKYSRTIHSLIKLVEKTCDTTVYNFVGNKKLLRCDEIDELLNDEQIHSNYYDDDSINNILEFKPNVVYVTRMQKERSEDNITNNICIDNDFLDKLPDNTILMHPLPRNDELDISCDVNKRSVYFQQIKNGIYVRMAIIHNLLVLNTLNEMI